MTRFAVLALIFVPFACHRAEMPMTLGDPAQGKAAIGRYGCVSCHRVPGFRGAHGMVGPSLEHFASRPTIGGTVPNTPENIIRWLQNPPAVAPGTSMPNVGMTPLDARNIAAYLENLK